MKQKDEVLGVKIVGGLREASTPWGGASLLVELLRRSGIDATANKLLPAKGSAKGFKQGQMVESFVVLSALGGDCIDDIRHLRNDAGLTRILGYQLPAPETARQWLDRFHDGSLMVAPLPLRLQVITHNLLQLLKRVALPEEYVSACPKRLRFSVFTVMGRILRHAGRVLLCRADTILGHSAQNCTRHNRISGPHTPQTIIPFCPLTSQTSLLLRHSQKSTDCGHLSSY